MNKYTGEVAVYIGDKKYTLVYDWRALGAVQTQYGFDAFKDMFKAPNPTMIADILAAGMKKNHPEMTQEAILDASPALIPAVRAIDKAVAAAYFGADAPEITEGDEAPKKGKKTQ